MSAQSTLVNPATTDATATTKTRKGPQEIRVDESSLNEITNEQPNKQIAFMVHPLLNKALLVKLASDPASLNPATTEADGSAKVTLKRTAYTRWLQKTVAAALGYTGEPVKPTVRGGNVMGIASAFQTVVRTMFQFAQNMQPTLGMNDEQLKTFAFDNAKQAVAANEALRSIEVSEEVLEQIWAGADVTLDVEEDDEEEEEEAAEQPPAAPEQPLA